MAKSPKAQAAGAATSTTTYPEGSQQGNPTMSAGNSFADILNAPADSFEPPAPLPEGSYTAMVDGMYKTGSLTNKDGEESNYIDFNMRLLNPREDVDPDLYAEATKGGKPPTMRYRMFLTERSAYRLKDFLTHLGIDLAGKSTTQALSETNGCQCMLLIRHRIYTPKGSQEQAIAVEVDRTAAL